MSRLSATVLILEALVIALAIVPAVKLSDATPLSAGLAAGVVLAALARRKLAVTLVGGSLLQVLVIVSGVILPVMYILGGIFALLWVTGIWLGHRVENST